MAEKGKEQRQEEGQKDEKSLADDILSFVKDHPGVHFNNILQILELSPGTLQYHLNRMERAKNVIVLRKRYYTRYFPLSMDDTVNQNIIILLRQRIPRKLLLILMEQPGKAGHELTQLLKITKSTLSYYTKRLEEIGVLNVNIEGREKRYSVIKPERIAQLLIEHKKSFKDEMVDRFVELWVRI